MKKIILILVLAFFSFASAHENEINFTKNISSLSMGSVLLLITKIGNGETQVFKGKVFLKGKGSNKKGRYQAVALKIKKMFIGRTQYIQMNVFQYQDKKDEISVFVGMGRTSSNKIKKLISSFSLKKEDGVAYSGDAGEGKNRGHITLFTI